MKNRVQGSGFRVQQENAETPRHGGQAARRNAESTERVQGLRVIISGLMLTMLCLGGCAPPEPNKLAAMNTVDVTIKGKKFHSWVADDSAETQAGLMHVTAEQMAPLADGTERGMLFVFDRDKSRNDGFWMKNTLIPLDIAFIRSDLTIVSILTMAALDESIYRPEGSYRYALEVNANVFSRLDIKQGDAVEIPAAVLKKP